MSIQPIAGAVILAAGRELAVSWRDGRRARFHAVWLRDNAQDERTRDPRNGQRLVTILDLPAEPTVALAEATPAGGLRLRFAPDGHETVFDGAWLRARIYDDGEGAGAPGAGGALMPDGAEPWDAGLAGRLPTVAFARAACDPEALAAWLDGVRRLGVALMSGVPAESGAVERVVALFGYVRETNYGRWFDVRAQIDPVNLAYTGLGLQVHTDNPYRDPVPTLQLLHCLADAAEGGESVVVDGFAAAAALRAEWPEDFALLARHSVPFEYRGTGGVYLRAEMPIIELTPEGRLRAVRFNNRSAAAPRLPYDVVPAFYRACRRFAAILERPALEVVFRLCPGDLFIVDNTRVLHGRKAFAGAGSRHLQGCYADRDGLLSTLAVLRARAAGRAA